MPSQQQLSLLRLGFTALVCYCVVRGLYEVFGGKGEFNRSGQTGSSPPLRCIRRSAHRGGKEGSLTKLVFRQVRDLVALRWLRSYSIRSRPVVRVLAVVAGVC